LGFSRSSRRAANGSPGHFMGTGATVPPVQNPVPLEGILLGTFLEGLSTLMGGVARMALGASVPFRLNRVFDLQVWHRPWN
jgi:hypothetical protein